MGLRRVRVATRKSALARWQAEHVCELLGGEGQHVECELVGISTEGDERAEEPVWKMGGKGAFTKAVQRAVLDGSADVAVHSAKDLPSSTPAGLVLAAVPRRGDPRDVLVGATLEGLAPGATVATGSVRRRAQLAWLRPDLTFTELRGNIGTRLERIPPGGAIVMAAAALARLDVDLSGTEHQVLEPSVMLPQVGQGALAVECRDDDVGLLELLALVEHRRSRLAVDAERAYLAELGGDCDLPAGAYATIHPDGSEITLEALLASPDGHEMRRTRSVGHDPARLGTEAATSLRAGRTRQRNVGWPSGSS